MKVSVDMNSGKPFIIKSFTLKPFWADSERAKFRILGFTIEMCKEPEIYFISKYWKGLYFSKLFEKSSVNLDI